MIPDSKTVDTIKFTNENKRTAPKISGASEMKRRILKESRNLHEIFHKYQRLNAIIQA